MSDLLAARRRYAEEIRGAADLRSPLLVRAFATVPREAFLGAGPWSVWNLERWRYETTPDADPLHVYRDAPIGIVPARLLNNGQPSFVARLIDALDLQPGETVVHVGSGTGYFTAIMAETTGGRGVVLRVVRGSEGYEARVVGSVMVFPCIGGVDAEADRRLADALTRLEEADTVRSLRRDRHEREPACWLHGEGYCLSALPAVQECALSRRLDRYPKVMVVHLTSVRRVGGEYPWEVDIPRGAAGLPVPSMAKCGEIYTLFKSHLEQRVGMLRGEKMGEIDRALATALALRV